MTQSSTEPTVLSLEEKRRLLVQQLQKKAERGTTYPLSFAQQRLWMVHQMDPASAAYNIAYALRLRGPLDVDALGRALTALVRRHEALRTVFPARDGVPVQLVRPAAPVVPAEMDLRPLPSEARETESARLAREEAALPFDLAAGPLLRVTVLRMADHEAILLLTLHHIVGDGWSQDVLVRDLSALYTAASEGREAALPPLPIQYADFAAWQRRWLTGEVLEQQLGYWRRRLDGAPPLLELPTDRPRTGSPGREAATHVFVLSPETSQALRALAVREGTTPFVTLLAAFKAVLARWTGQDDVVVGTPVAGRSRMEVEDLIGFFVNVLVLRTDLSGDPSFRALMARVRDGVLEAYAHQDLPFERLVDEVQPARNLTNTPLFQALFSFQVSTRDALRLGVLELERVPGGAESAKYDLSLAMGDDGEEMAGSFTYRTGLFDAATVERMAAHLTRLLDAVSADADVRTPALELMGEAERRQVLEAWNQTEAAYPADVCIHHLFEAQARRTPDAPAAVFEDEALTYGELNARANRLAQRLLRLGAGPDVPVALCLERGLEMIVAVLGILKAGGAYVALAPTLPMERLGFMLRDSGAAALVTHRALADALSTADVPTVLLDDADALADEPATDPKTAVRPEHLAYAVYTSGSTGTPKAVGVEHRQLAGYLSGLRDRLGLEAGASYATVSTLSADLGNTVVFSALAWGGTLHVIGEERLFSGEALAEYFERHRIDALKITPSHLAALQGGVADPRRVMPRRWLVLGGEASGLAWADELLRLAPAGCALFNHYGPTETTVGALAFRMTPERPETPSGTLVLGRPLSNYRAYVVDAALRPVPEGVAGELLIGGAGVSRGYLGRPALTAEKFVPDPFGTRPGARLYRTGDRGRWRADGLLEFIGRFDDQVKIRGFRIEPGEVQAALRAHPAVRDCVVVAREDVPGEPRLVAYVVGRAEAEPLRAHLRQRLPEHMVPAAFVALEGLPMTSNGKLDHRALPAPEPAPAGERSAAPRTPVEAALAEVWREVLGVEAVGREDGFFELGGHSLLIVRLQARLRERLGREVSIVDLFRHPTVAALARHLDGGAPGAAAADPREDGERRVHPSGTAETSGDGARDGGFAIIGMAGRFPGAADVDAFWSNLRGGVHAVSFFSDDEMRAAGVSPERLRDPAFVRAGGVLQGADRFDAAFFGFSPREAEVMDPQHRVFLETAWEALENAGYAPGTTRERVGIFAGSSTSPYFTRHVLARPDILEAVGFTQVKHANDKDFLATRAAHRLNLRGPALSLQTGCSTGLVAVHVACQSLAAGDCGLALAGGVSVRAVPARGYRHVPGGIASPDGFCRAFDARAAGTVDGDGIGLVVLKRLADALADGDTIHAVVRGTAVNNDGARKVGFTAPSVEGQAQVIADALARAGVAPDSIGYVEAHGSGTELGDPIEVAALAQAFGPTARTQFCALGSVKTSIGHLDAAAGAAGLIKAALAVEHGEIPRVAALRHAQPQHRLRVVPLLRQRGPAAVGDGRGGAAAGRCVVVRRGRHQRARGPGAGAGAGTLRPRPRLAPADALRPHTRGAGGGDGPAGGPPARPPGAGAGGRRVDAAGGPPRVRPPARGRGARRR